MMLNPIVFYSSVGPRSIPGNCSAKDSPTLRYSSSISSALFRAACIRPVRQACDPETFEIQSALPLRQSFRRPIDPHERGLSVRQCIDFRPQGDVSPKLWRRFACRHGRKDFARRLATAANRLQGKALKPSQSGFRIRLFLKPSQRSGGNPWQGRVGSL